MVKSSNWTLIFLCFFLTLASLKAESSDEYLEEQILKAVTEDEKKCLTTAGELIFVLDASTSVGPDDFNKEKDFAIKIVDRLAVGKNLTRVALMTYNSFPSLVFNIDQYNTSKEINQQIMKAEFTEGITVVGDALHKVVKEIEPKTRPKIGKVIVLLSDGKRNGGMDPYLVAKQLKSNNYTIITIGLDKDSDEAAMKAISSNNMYYTIKNFDSLEKIVNTIVSISCITFHKAKCPSAETKKDVCKNEQQAVHITSYYFLDGKCVPEYRKLIVNCLNPNECPKQRFTINPCKEGSNKTQLLNVTSYREGTRCFLKSTFLKDVACGCAQSIQDQLTIVLGTECKNGMKSQVLVYNEFRLLSCQKSFFTLPSVTCQELCKGRKDVSTSCVNGSRTINSYVKKFVNNKCDLVLEKSAVLKCATVCPKSVQITSNVCVNNTRAVTLISYENVNMQCVERTKKLDPVKCVEGGCPPNKVKRSRCILGRQAVLKVSYTKVGTECKRKIEKVGLIQCVAKKCQKSTYSVPACTQDSKATHLVKTYYSNANGTCVKKTKNVKELSCKCYEKTKGNITVVVGKECEKGFRSRELILQEERQGKCVDMKFTLRRIKCLKRCFRRRYTVTKCKDNKREVVKTSGRLVNGKCELKVVNKKTVKCNEVCPKPMNKTTRCIRGKQAVLRVTFRESGNYCKAKVVRLRISTCQKTTVCPNSTFGVEKCEKNAKNTFLVKNYFRSINGTCVKKTRKVKELSCKCYETTKTNLSLTIGKVCKKGFRSRELVLQEERQGKCVDVKFTLRRIKCTKRCFRRRYRVTKCKDNKREVVKTSGRLVNGKCELKVVNKKTVKCNEVCPKPMNKTTRCIRGQQAVLQVTFRESGNYCKAKVVRLKIGKCQPTIRCPNSTYEVAKCDKDAKTTSLIRHYYTDVNGTCVKRLRKVREMSCKCYEATKRNITVVVGRECDKGYRTQELILKEERQGRCVDVKFTLRRIECIKRCLKRELRVTKCKDNKREVARYTQKLVNGICQWQEVAKKVIPCKTPCPEDRQHTTRCVLGKQALLQIKFKEDVGSCKATIIRLKMIPCGKEGKCKNTTYEVEKCQKGQNKSSLIRTYHRYNNGTCVQKTQKLKELPCKCYENRVRDVTIVVGTICQNGYRSRELVLHEERQGQCVDVKFSLRRITCLVRCLKREFRITTCKDRKREVSLYKEFLMDGKCEWKLAEQKIEPCNSTCPNSRRKTTRCVLGKQALLEINFKEENGKCKATIIRLKMITCGVPKICGNRTYEVTKCDKNSKTTFLTRTSYVNANGSCVARKLKMKELPCKCYLNASGNLTVSFGKTCERGFRSRELVVFLEKEGKCVNFAIKLGVIKCVSNCGEVRNVPGPCQNAKRLVKTYENVLANGTCAWKLVKESWTSCVTDCPQPKTTETPCLFGKKAIVRTTYQLVGQSCIPKVERLRFLNCKNCTQRSYYKVENCEKGSNTSNLVRISFENCKKKVEVLKKVNCMCDAMNRRTLKISPASTCVDGKKTRTLFYYDKGKSTCEPMEFVIRGIKCGCYGFNMTISTCKNGNRTLNFFKKVEAAGKCEHKMLKAKTLKCKSICPEKMVKTSKCINKKKFETTTEYKQVGDFCKSVYYQLRWSNCSISIISNKECSKKYVLTVSNCTKGNASIIATKEVKKNGTCVKEHKKIAEVECSDKCERTLRPKLVSGRCVKNIKLIFSVSTKAQNNKCLNHVTYLGTIKCKDC